MIKREPRKLISYFLVVGTGNLAMASTSDFLSLYLPSSYHMSQKLHLVGEWTPHQERISQSAFAWLGWIPKPRPHEMQTCYSSHSTHSRVWACEFEFSFQYSCLRFAIIIVHCWGQKLTSLGMSGTLLKVLNGYLKQALVLVLHLALIGPHNNWHFKF